MIVTYDMWDMYDSQWQCDYDVMLNCNPNKIENKNKKRIIKIK